MALDNADKSSVISSLLAKFPRGNQNVSFEEAYELLEETESAMGEVSGDKDLCATLGRIRDELVQRLDIRAKEIGMTEKWEQMKKYRSALLATDELQQTDSGKEFFDTFAGLPPEQRNALDSLEQEGLLDVSDVKRNEPLARALKEGSTMSLFVAMLRTHPVRALGLFLRYYGWIIAASCALILFVTNLRVSGAMALGLAIVLLLLGRWRGGAQA